jgi:hypothetical protein
MKKALSTLIILAALTLYIPLSAWADFEIGLGVFKNNNDSCISVNMNPKDLANIICTNVGLPGWTIVTADSIDTGETRLYSTSYSEFEIVRKVLEPNTMLMLGGCLLGFSFFTIKFRR